MICVIAAALSIKATGQILTYITKCCEKIMPKGIGYTSIASKEGKDKSIFFGNIAKTY